MTAGGVVTACRAACEVAFEARSGLFKTLL